MNIAPCFGVLAGLYDVELNIDKLSAIKDQHEQQQETESEKLRLLKAQNEQVGPSTV